MTSSVTQTLQAESEVVVPRVTIKYCTQCKWMLRAAYFAQELLSTFSTSLGEIALIPSTGGVFTIDIIYPSLPTSLSPSQPLTAITTTSTQLWDRKQEGGFPEVKHLKQLVRNVIDPARDLGHVDRDHQKEKAKKDTLGHKDGPAAREGETGDEETKKGNLGQDDLSEPSGATGESTDPTSEYEPKTKHEDVGEVKEDCEDCA